MVLAQFLIENKQKIFLQYSRLYKNRKKHSGHRTNKSFERYYQMDDVESADMAELIIKKKAKTEVLEFKKEGSDKMN